MLFTNLIVGHLESASARSDKESPSSSLLCLLTLINLFLFLFGKCCLIDLETVVVTSVSMTQIIFQNDHNMQVIAELLRVSDENRDKARREMVCAQ